MPGSLDLRGSLELCNILGSSDPSNDYVLDFKKTGTIEPCGMLLASSEIRRFCDQHGSEAVRFVNYNHMTYAGHMGFFKAFGLDFGKSPGEARGGRSYIPLTIMSVESLVESAAQIGTEVGNEVERESRQLAETLIGARP